MHILNDSQRGATVEAVVSRMKTLETAQELDNSTHIRFVAVSATMPNYKDVCFHKDRDLLFFITCLSIQNKGAANKKSK